jgi:hypothetical protein
MVTSIFKISFTSAVSLILTGTAIAQDIHSKNINRGKMELISVAVVENVEADQLYWAELKVTARLPRWHRPKVENHRCILLGGKLSPYPGVLSYASTYLDGNQLFACRQRSDRSMNKCVYVADMDTSGYLDVSQIDAYYTKVTRTIKERIFCSLIPICTPNGFDFITIEYSPK